MNIVSVGIEFELDSTSTVSAFGDGVSDTVGVGRKAVSVGLGVAIGGSEGTGWVAAF